MKEKDLTLRGVTLSAGNGSNDQLLVTMAIGEVVNNAIGERQTFPVPQVVTLSLEPYRLVIPLKDKCALVARGSEAEFHVSGTEDKPKVEFVRAKEFKTALSFEDFLASLHEKEE